MRPEVSHGQDLAMKVGTLAVDTALVSSNRFDGLESSSLSLVSPRKKLILPYVVPTCTILSLARPGVCEVCASSLLPPVLVASMSSLGVVENTPDMGSNSSDTRGDCNSQILA